MLISLRRGNLARSVARCFGVAALALSVSAAARADFLIDGTVFVENGLYNYNVSVTNNGAEELALVSLLKTGVLTTVESASAPDGFQIDNSFVDGTGYVDFFPVLGSSAGFFPGTTVSGFHFTSATLLFPNPEIYGLDVAGGSTDNGGISGNALVVAAPEPGTIALLAPALFAGAFLVRRRNVG